MAINVFFVASGSLNKIARHFDKKDEDYNKIDASKIRKILRASKLQMRGGKKIANIISTQGGNRHDEVMPMFWKNGYPQR
jgi:hypothetical protein